MTNSTSTTVVEVTKHIQDTVIMPHDSQCQSRPHLMSRCHDKDTDRLRCIGLILNKVIFAFKMSLLSETHLMTDVINPTSYSRHTSCQSLQVKCYSID